ncbi:MAG: DHH family phosphoesterase [Promethearchaeati archaeon SRVP18_Atabeyarchaeia-1]
MVEQQPYAGFSESINETASKLLNEICGRAKITVISHLDSDGLSAAGIICSALHRSNARFHLRVLRQLRRQKIEELAQEQKEVFVFVDLGSGQIDQISECMSKSRVFILDHHPPANPAARIFAHVNPHLFGIDGTNQVSASGVAYFVAKAMDPSNIALSALAIVGAIGDQQDKGEQRSLTGLNAEIVRDAEKVSLVQVTKDIRLFGRETRPIHVALEYTTEPYVPGLTGNGDACAKLLLNLGIRLKEGETWRTLSSLTQEEKTRLVSELVMRMISRGMDSKDAESIIGTVYTFIKEDKGTPLRDAREFSSLLNACGRMGYPGLGVAVCIGDRGEALKETQNILTQYRRKLAEYLEWIEKPNFVKETEHLQYFNGEDKMDDRMIGPVTSIAIASHMLKTDRPVVALASSEDNLTKVSARATDELVKKGINLGNAIRDAITGINGEAEGGGHDIAAGAFITRGREDIFLLKLEDSIKKQLENRKS